MPCTPAVLNLPTEEVRVQVGEGGKGEAGGTRMGSSSSNSNTSNNLNSNSSSNNNSNVSSRNLSISSSNSSNLSNSVGTAAAGMQLCWLTSNIVGMPRPAGILGMTQVPCRSRLLGRFPFPRWVGYLPIHRLKLCHRCPRRRRAGAFHLLVRVGGGGVGSDATDRASVSRSALFPPRI